MRTLSLDYIISEVIGVGYRSCVYSRKLSQRYPLLCNSLQSVYVLKYNMTLPNKNYVESNV